jgi:hypothetical protein
MFYRRVILVFLWCVSVSLAQDKIRGTYSYTYGDKESLVEARQTCKDLAIREAIESYYIFVESSTEVENFQLKEDIIQSITAGYLKNVTVVDQKEEGRTVTMVVEATVMPDEVKALVEKLMLSGEKEKTPAEDSSRVDDATTAAVGKPGNFLSILAEVEKRINSTEEARDQRKFSSALRQMRELQPLLERYKPLQKDTFQWHMYQAITTRTAVLSDLLRVEYFESQGQRARAGVNMRLAANRAVELRSHMKKLENLTRLTERQKTVRNVCTDRCQQVLERVKKKASAYRRR